MLLFRTRCPKEVMKRYVKVLARRYALVLMVLMLPQFRYLKEAIGNLRGSLGAELCPGAHGTAGEEASSARASASDAQLEEEGHEGTNNNEADHLGGMEGEGEPYVVPDAWQRVLRAWNDPAIGAGLAIVNGHGQGHDEHGGLEHLEDADVGEPGNVHSANPGHSSAVAAGGPSSSPTRRSRTASERGEGGPKQTNLKGWLK